MRSSQKRRDFSIEKAYRREISLTTKVVRNKKAYTRKQKHGHKDAEKFSDCGYAQIVLQVR